ncbi:type II toxin-antitoxin system RelE/ParE family toxin [Terriglobus sp.]|uniref:type II toxin-antitoxin system RelE/ParE family toxin n=1 Tax=Terriglobus sp. TaxID=1889013 RepID=UPI003B00859B
MIKSFRHAGLEKFFLTGSKAGIVPDHARRLTIQLSALNVASRPEEINQPGWDWHPLQAGLAGHFAIKVNKNWRLTFVFEGEDAVLTDYQDYH